MTDTRDLQPDKVTITFHICPLCSTRYESRESAEECIAQGLKKVVFRLDDILKRLGYLDIQIVSESGLDHTHDPKFLVKKGSKVYEMTQSELLNLIKNKQRSLMRGEEIVGIQELIALLRE